MRSRKHRKKVRQWGRYLIENAWCRRLKGDNSEKGQDKGGAGHRNRGVAAKVTK